MLQERAVERGYVFRGCAIHKHGIENVHANDVVAQLLGRARLRRFQQLAVIGKVDAVAREDGVLAAGYAHHVELQAVVLLQLLIL